MERNDADKLEEVMLPGFRFHPTDEELVGFYLKRKIQQKPLSIELIKQLDIYKYDPWDLPSKSLGLLSYSCLHTMADLVYVKFILFIWKRSFFRLLSP